MHTQVAARSNKQLGTHCYNQYNKSAMPCENELTMSDLPAASLLRTEHRIPTLCAPVGHFSDAVSYGGLLFISGLVAVNVEGELVGADNVTVQAEQVYDNIKLALDHAGLQFSDILKITTFLTSIDDRGAVDLVRRAKFGAAKPASTLVEVSALAFPGLKIEVEAIAAMRA